MKCGMCAMPLDTSNNGGDLCFSIKGLDDMVCQTCYVEVAGANDTVKCVICAREFESETQGYLISRYLSSVSRVVCRSCDTILRD